MSDVTVVVPFKRGGRDDWLKEALASIPQGIPYIVLENDGELHDALNAGLAQAETEYVLRLDADDLLDEPSVQMLLDAAWDVDVAYPSLTLVSEEPDEQGRLYRVGQHESGEFCPHRLMVHNYVPGAGCVIRRKAALAAGGYRDLPALEDWDLWVRMVNNGSRFKWRPDATYYYRQVEGSRNKMSFEEALDLKKQIVASEPGLLATWYAQETVATCYWRCSLPARHLPGQVVLHRPTVAVVGDEVLFPHHRGVAVWQFPGHSYERFSMAAMQECGVPVLLETDDNYTVTAPHRSHWKNRMPERGEENLFPSVEMHRRIAGWVDGVIVTTEHLGRQYRKVTDAPIHVCPNQIDPDDWPDLNVGELNDRLAARGLAYDENTTYVGLAISPSHLPDLKLVAQALEWCAGQRDVEVVVFGPLPMTFARRFEFWHFPWSTDMSVYRKLTNILDIGLAPVVENPWSACRSDLKVLEYSMVGAASVVSDVIPYRGWRDGELVRKAQTPRDFLRVVQELVRDRDGTRAMAAEARRHVLAERTVAGNAWRWREAVETTVEAKAA